MAFQRKKDDLYQSRRFSIQVVFVAVALILLIRAFSLQVLDKSYADQAEATAVSKHVLYPSRGLIYDRNNELLVINNPVYDVMATYNQISPEMDTLKFCKLLGIDKAYFETTLDKDFKRDRRYSKLKPFVFLKKISAETYAQFQESMYEFPGFEVQVRNVRGYPHQNASHVLGFIREVNQKEVSQPESSYVPGDYIGASGLERAYESYLKGQKGANYILRDSRGRQIDKFNGGKRDSVPISGQDLKSTLDIHLQSYAEELMQNKVGGVVAIEPNTGEILAMTSSPAYDPNLITINRSRGEAYKKLQNDSLKPLFNRALMAEYPPGSIFKPVMALVAMQLGVLDPNKYMFCPGYYEYNGTVWGCRQHPPNYNVGSALQFSCNRYFYIAFRDVIDIEDFYKPGVGLDTLRGFLKKFGMGQKLGIDFPVELDGNIPTRETYDRMYPSRKGGWKSPTIISVGIGQGELLMSTLQMANISAIIANRGYFVTPHLVKEMNGSRNTEKLVDYQERNSVDINPEYFQPVIDGMAKVVTAGTGASAYIPTIPIAGKTGTVENPFGEDHSTFIAFAPIENPKIAIAVYVENAGGGGKFAAPIASLLIEKYLHGDIGFNRVWKEKQILESSLIDETP